MKKTLLLTLALGLLGTSLAFASGRVKQSGLSADTSTPRDTFSDSNALAVTETVRCYVTRVADGQVFIRDGEGQPEHVLPYSEKTKFVAQKKKDFDGRKKLGVEDVRVGQTLKVTMLAETREIVRVKVFQQG